MAGLVNTDEMFDLRISEGAKLLFEKVKAFIREEVARRRPWHGEPAASIEGER